MTDNNFEEKMIVGDSFCAEYYNNKSSEKTKLIKSIFSKDEGSIKNGNFSKDKFCVANENGQTK